MSQALPNEHYCQYHQGNTSHYAKENCRVCQLEKEVAILKSEVERLKTLNDQDWHDAEVGGEYREKLERIKEILCCK